MFWNKFYFFRIFFFLIRNIQSAFIFGSNKKLTNKSALIKISSFFFNLARPEEQKKFWTNMKNISSSNQADNLGSRSICTSGRPLRVEATIYGLICSSPSPTSEMMPVPFYSLHLPSLFLLNIFKSLRFLRTFSQTCR